jgi:hypothetical protein
MQTPGSMNLRTFKKSLVIFICFFKIFGNKGFIMTAVPPNTPIPQPLTSQHAWGNVDKPTSPDSSLLESQNVWGEDLSPFYGKPLERACLDWVVVENLPDQSVKTDTVAMAVLGNTPSLTKDFSAGDSQPIQKS